MAEHFTVYHPSARRSCGIFAWHEGFRVLGLKAETPPPKLRTP